jgi:CRISPR-associated protein Cmr5
MAGPDLAQRRALHALKAIEAYRETGGSDPKAYAGYIKSFPATIVMNGLGQALAMERAQGGKDPDKGQGGKAPNAHKQIYLHVEDWLCGEDETAVFQRAKEDQPRLLHCLYGADQAVYLRAQAEALLYVGWLKKFAVALLSDENEGAQDGRS